MDGFEVQAGPKWRIQGDISNNVTVMLSVYLNSSADIWCLQYHVVEKTLDTDDQLSISSKTKSTDEEVSSKHKLS